MANKGGAPAWSRKVARPSVLAGAPPFRLQPWDVLLTSRTRREPDTGSKGSSRVLPGRPRGTAGAGRLAWASASDVHHDLIGSQPVQLIFLLSQKGEEQIHPATAVERVDVAVIVDGGRRQEEAAVRAAGRRTSEVVHLLRVCLVSARPLGLDRLQRLLVRVEVGEAGDE